MWTVTSLDDLRRLEHSNAVISVLLAERYNKTLLEWVYHCWNFLSRDSGHNWHIAVPSTINTYELNIKFEDGNLTSNDYSTGFSRQLASMYGIDLSSLPCVVFDDFNEESRQKYIHLHPFDEELITEIFRIGAKCLNTMDRSLSRTARTSNVLNEIGNYIRMRRLKQAAPTTAGLIGSALGLL